MAIINNDNIITVDDTSLTINDNTPSKEIFKITDVLTNGDYGKLQNYDTTSRQGINGYYFFFVYDNVCYYAFQAYYLGLPYSATGNQNCNVFNINTSWKYKPVGKSYGNVCIGNGRGGIGGALIITEDKMNLFYQSPSFTTSYMYYEASGSFPVELRS